MMTVRNLASCTLLVVVLCTGCEPSAPKDSSVAPTDVPHELSEHDLGEDLGEVQRLVASRNFSQAREVLRLYLRRHPNDPLALEMAGDGAIQANDLATAIEYFEAAVTTSQHSHQSLWLKWAGATMSAERPFETIEVLKKAVKEFPNSLEIRQNLTSFLARVGLQGEAAEHLQWLVQRNHGTLSILLQLADLTTASTHEPTCQSALRQNPRDLRPMFSLSQLDVAESKWREIESALDPVVNQHPDFLPAVALYGRALVELRESERVLNWSDSLPQEIEAYSQYWIAAGNWALRNESMEQAAGAFWRAVQLNENDSEALHGLANSLSRLGRKEQAKVAARRLEQLVSLRGHIASLSTWDFDSQKTVVDIALTLQELGRPWEATNWLMIAHSMRQHPDPKLNDTFHAIRNGLAGTTPWQLAGQTVSMQMDLSTMPVVDWSLSSSQASLLSPHRSKRPLRLHDEALARSLQHVCAIGKPEGHESGLMIYQSGAGGAGVFDLDLDGWPDLYLTVMDGTPNRRDSQPNRLYRNLEGRFSDVTECSQLLERGFSQGVCVGDYNADGWPDMYVANIGKNRLYQNNGDGTFKDVTDQCKLDAAGWTTSVAIADLNADGHADLFEVGYCGDEAPLTQECIVPTLGQARSCNPLAFNAEPDRIWKGNGDGTFSDATHWLGAHQEGRGFALVVGDLDHQLGLEVYVANDMTANHYWARSGDSNEFMLTEQATIRGLAFNHSSIAQASMGIAAADADNDGDIDFLVTHFSQDHNTYYKQVQPGVWTDDSQATGFVASSMPMLAYGTQWIDVDNDGILEVFIANGDIDDFRFEGRDFRQPAQLLSQVTQGRWNPLEADPLGEYFSKDRLGRAVASLDANRDGRTDLFVTHLFDPVALLINRSESAFKQTRFFLRGRTTHRDAIGASVRFSLHQANRQQQLLAGNGYQCVNEACLVFGVANAGQLEGVQVSWPNGINESLGDLDAGGDYLIIEGLGAWRLDP